MNEQFDEELQEAYSKTMLLAIDLASNKTRFTKSPPSHNDKKFLKKIHKVYKEFQDSKDKRRKRAQNYLNSTQNSEIPQLRHNKTEFLPKDSGKNKLNSSIRERMNFVSESRAGKVSKFTEVGPGVLERIKMNTSINFEDSVHTQGYEKVHNLPHVSILTGKVKPALELPSFKEYVKGERSKDVKDQVFDKINRCQKHLEEFKKELSGLEIFVNTNPGVAWNHDKKVLLKLNANPLQKNSIIKTYNRVNKISLVKLDLKSSTRQSRVAHLESLTSKTPGSDHFQKFSFPDTTKNNYDPSNIVEKCFRDFREAREYQNKNLIKIMDSLKAKRPVSLMEKAKLIINDQEKFRDRGYSLRKMEQFKRKIDENRITRIKKSFQQVKLYDNIMEFLKRKVGGPNDSEINLVEVIKEVLEEGWFLDRGLLDRILTGFELEEIKEMAMIVEFILSELESDEENKESVKVKF
jgi:hypothetical protein